MKAYFLPGMCVNCKVFDQLTLPEGYERVYIEWLPPQDETFEEYVRKMAASINTGEPFVLIGYSMGGVIMQQMNRFLKPEKNILISSMKSLEEIPPLFRVAKKTRINKHLTEQIYRINKQLPEQIYRVHKPVSDLFARLFFAMNADEIENYIAYTSADYLKWAVYHITEWEPEMVCENLYHIHGTKDQIFPFKQIRNAFVVEGGDHIMILRKAGEVSRVIGQILS